MTKTDGCPCGWELCHRALRDDAYAREAEGVVLTVPETASLATPKEPQMILAGIVLIVLGLVFAIPLLWILGLVLVIVGAFAWAGPYHRRWY